MFACFKIDQNEHRYNLNMKKIVFAIKNKIVNRNKKSVFGPRIFVQQSWLSKQVQEAQIKSANYTAFGIQ